MKYEATWGDAVGLGAGVEEGNPPFSQCIVICVGKPVHPIEVENPSVGKVMVMFCTAPDLSASRKQIWIGWGG